MTQTTEAEKIAASLDAAKRTRWRYVDAPKPARRPPPAPACAEPERPLAPADGSAANV
jgi:hypothetical protein